uniref:Placental growth factor n=1 Tax=Canis lupus dingo TaxID=286419 RepID=A0A8C0JMH7_CANLU
MCQAQGSLYIISLPAMPTSDYDDKQFNVEFQALTLRWIYSEGLDDSWDLMTWMVMQLALSAGNGSSEVEVVSFQQVWGRSYCRALEKLVDVLSEYPDEVEHMFNPSCVSLLRCSGCCGDENLHCMPVETANVTMQLLMIHSTGRPSYVELTFSQHIRCQCRPPLEDMKLERRRPKGRGKRKREKQRPTDCHLCGHTVPQR